MRVAVTVTMDLNLPIEEIGKLRLRQYVRSAVKGWKGGLLPEDELYVGIGEVHTSPVIRVLTSDESKSAGGVARAKKLSSLERQTIARKAAVARWAKHKKTET